MTDLGWITQEAQMLHGIFRSLFFASITVLLLLGVVLEFFKMPLGVVPAFPQLVGRALICGILLASYPEIANSIAAVADGLAEKIGDLNTFKNVLGKAGGVISKLSWSWTSIGDSFVFIVSYLSFCLLHVTVFFFDAAVSYAWVLLYVFSPLLIALFILPQTSSATAALFRSLIEVSAWKVVCAVLGTLLWSTALRNFENVGDQTNFITVLTYTIILSLSVICTPLVVRSLFNKGVSGLASTLGGAAGSALLASAGGAAGIKMLALGPTQATVAGVRRIATTPFQKSREFIARRNDRQSNAPTQERKRGQDRKKYGTVRRVDEV